MFNKKFAPLFFGIIIVLFQLLACGDDPNRNYNPMSDDYLREQFPTKDIPRFGDAMGITHAIEEVSK